VFNNNGIHHLTIPVTTRMKNLRYKSGVFTFIAMLMATVLYAQNFPDLQFSHITAKEGLSSNYATAITEDKQGFIWIGTANGLNRYDGYRIKHYYHSNTDSNSLVSNAIQKMYCDNSNRIWICTEDGVSCFDPATNRFINYAVSKPAPRQLNNNSSVTVYEDEQHTIWLCNQANVIYKIASNMEAIPLPVHAPAFSFFQQQRLGYEHIFRDNTGTEWAFNSNRIYKLDKKTKQAVRTFDFSAVLQQNILKMTQDADGNYIIATWNAGLYRFDPATASLELFTAMPKRIFTDAVNVNWQNNQWLLCIEANYGLYLYNSKKKQAKLYTYIPGDATTLQGNSLTQSFIDRKGNIWIGGNGGVNLLTAGQNAFNIIPITEPGAINYSLYKNGPVFSYLETDSSIWLSKRFVSTLEYNQQFQLRNCYTSLSPVSTTLHQPYSDAYSFFQQGNELFISTDSGFIVYDLHNKSSHTYLPPNESATISFRTIIPLNDHDLLVRTFESGVFIFNTLTKQFTRHYRNENICADCPSLKLTYALKHSNGDIYLCTQGQQNSLLKYQPGKDLFTVVRPNNYQQFALQGSNLFGMAEDKAGRLWITGAAGLFIYDPTSNNIVQQVASGKEMGGLFRICFDDMGNAWVNAVSGIWCYVKATGKWIGFNSEDGLPGSQFEATIAKRPNGDILAGLEGAIALFHPKQLFSTSNEPSVIITEALLDDSTISFPLIAAAAKKLILPAGSNSFTVDFALLNYINPAASRYYYRLLPLMKEFQLNDNGHINFNGLVPGTYQLQVKAGNKAGIIYSNQDILSIEILPYWYQTTWFKLLCFAIVGIGLLFFIKWRIRSAKKQAELKQTIAETEMQALRAQMNPHFIFNSLNSIENFMMQNEKRLASDYLNKFSRLIRSILDSSQHEMVPVAKDMEALQWYVDLQLLRLNNKFSYRTAVDPVLLEGDFKVPCLLIQPFVENAIEHGLSHSDRDDCYLAVKAVLDNNYIVYTIEDNGIGRKRSAEYNQQNKPYHKSAGLSITAGRLRIINKEAANHNSIEITDLYNSSNEPAGTRVTLRIKPQ
jgi:ligand-binding sensor domain-containing protein